MASTIQIRVEDELKNKSDELFKMLGTDTTSAIRMFLTQAVMNHGFPFEIKLNNVETNPFAPMSEDELMQKLENSMQQAKQGAYKGADNVISHMRENMDYEVVITEDAEEDLDRFIQYLLFEKRNGQAAKSLLEDFENTIHSLEQVAGSLKYCENTKLRTVGYKRMNFMAHRYFMIYHIDGDRAIVDNIFHQLQDYENKLC